jgi:hypothetical protein
MDEWGLLKDVGDAPKVAPMQPWALKLYTERQQRFLRDDPMYLNCKPPGGPRQFQLHPGVQFVEDRARQRIFVLIGSGNNNYRIIYTDGRSHQGQVGGDDENPLFYGRAVGKWEGETLVVDVTGLNGLAWFDRAGDYSTDNLHVVERFTKTDASHLNYEATITDDKVFSRPWKINMPLYKRVEKNAQILEFKCVEFAEELLYGKYKKQPTTK